MLTRVRVRASIAKSEPPSPRLSAGVPSMPKISFFKLITDGEEPHAASRSALGTLPFRATQFCESVSLASSTGWYIYLPIDIYLYFDGSTVHWSLDGDDFMLLTTAQYPDFSDRFNSAAPDSLHDSAPPFISKMIDSGLIQIWTGCFVQTDAEWWTQTHAPVNLPRNSGYELFEGVIETDKWFGPLFTPIRLLKTDTIIHISSSIPFMQIQVVPSAAFARDISQDAILYMGVEKLQSEHWESYEQSVVAHVTAPERKLGSQTKEFRRRTRKTQE